MPCCNTAIYKRLQRALYRQCNYTTHATKQRTGLYSGLSSDYASSTAHNTRPTQAAIMPPAPRRTLYRTAQPSYYNKVYNGAAVCLCYRSMPDGATDRRPCKPGGVSMLPTPGGLQSGTGQQSWRTGSVWHPPPGGLLPGIDGRRQRANPAGGRSDRQTERQAGQQRVGADPGSGGGTLDGLRRTLFRAFAR